MASDSRTAGAGVQGFAGVAVADGGQAATQNQWNATVRRGQDWNGAAQPQAAKADRGSGAPVRENTFPDLRAEYYVKNRMTGGTLNAKGLALDLSKESPAVLEASMTRLTPEMQASVCRELAPIQLEIAARLHGQTQGRLDTLQAEMQELWACHERQACRPFNMEHARAGSGDVRPVRERADEIQQYVQAGLAEQGADRWDSTVFERAIKNGLITSQADQEHFKQIAESERSKTVAGWAIWRSVELGLSLAPGNGAGAGSVMFARAPQSASAALSGLNQTARRLGIAGTYQNVMETMSLRAMRFQQLVSGGVNAGTSFVRNGVRFDFVDTVRGVLVDAKGPGYANFVNKQTGKFYDWFERNGAQMLVDQADRQSRAAKGMPVEWVFAEREAMEATRRLFRDANIQNITLRLQTGL
jgi:hypothetical protein